MALELMNVYTVMVFTVLVVSKETERYRKALWTSRALIIEQRRSLLSYLKCLEKAVELIRV